MDYIVNNNIRISYITKLSKPTVEIIQSPHQTITVTCAGVDYTETFNGEFGDAYVVNIVADEGYDPGELSHTYGVLTRENQILTIEATEATEYGIIAGAYTYSVANNNFPTTLVDGKNFEINGDYVRSGSVSYNIDRSHSKGYITFTTPDTIPDDCNCVTIKAYVSSEGSSYDYGYVYIQPSSTPNYSNGNSYTSGTTNGRMMAQGGTSNSLTTFTSGVLSPNTTYTLSFGYRKDSSSSYGSDRFFIKEVTLPTTVIAKKQEIYTIGIIQTENQTITVKDKSGLDHTETFTIKKGENWTAKIESNDETLVAGALNMIEGDGNRSVVLYAPPAHIAEIVTFTIIQSANQTIIVTIDDIDYTETFTILEGKSWTARIESIGYANGIYYQAGELSATQGIVSGNITISATSVIECTNDIITYTDGTIYSQAMITGTVSGYSNNTSIETVLFPAAVSISKSAFYSCSRLITVSFPNCSYIGSSAFQNCYILITVSFPNCSYIGSSAFYNCYSLTTASFPNCSRIGSSAFYRCSRLTTVSFPVCSYIESRAFEECSSLTTVSFPKCSYIGEYAFYNCSRLASLYLMSTSVVSLYNSRVFSSTPIAGYTNYNSGVYGSIFVHASLLATYKTATNWAYFSSRFVGV